MRVGVGVERISSSNTFKDVGHAISIAVQIWIKRGGAVDLFPDIAHAVDIDVDLLGVRGPGGAQQRESRKDSGPAEEQNPKTGTHKKGGLRLLNNVKVFSSGWNFVRP